MATTEDSLDSRSQANPDPESICLCCSNTTVPRQRRMLRSESTKQVIPTLATVLERVLEEAGKPYTKAGILGVINGEYNSLGYICRNCYTDLLKCYKDTCALMDKVKNVIDVVSFTEESSESSEPAVGTKRPHDFNNEIAQSHKKAKISHSEPEMSVSIYGRCR